MVVQYFFVTVKQIAVHFTGYKKFSLVYYLIVVLAVSCVPGKKALVLIDQQKYDKAKVWLNKALAKDSINADAKYAYSLLYSDTAYQNYQLDSAYYYILSARSDFNQPDTTKKQKMLTGNVVTDSTLIQQQKVRIDSMAFRQATVTNTVAAYQRFLNNFPTALQVQEAVAQRNALAFKAAAQTNTYQAYEKFMATYPDAIQIDQARIRYNNLIFKEKTKEGTLDSYLTFLINFPDTPYRDQAEKAIFEISTADNMPQSYFTFVQRFPESTYTRRAVNMLYHLYKTTHKAQNFLTDYDDLPFADSLRNIMQSEADILIPFFENGRYGFFNSSGTVIAPARYDGMTPNYFCHGISDDFMHVVQGTAGQYQNMILTKDNRPIFTYTLNDDEDEPNQIAEKTVADLGSGMLKVWEKEGYLLIHKSGYSILESVDGIEEIELCGEPTYSTRKSQAPPYQFIKFKQNAKWGLCAFSGKIILDPLYDDIDISENFALVEKKGRIAITNREKLLEKANNAPLPLSFIYEDVSLINENHVIAYEDELETVIDDLLNMVVPLAEHSVIRPVKVGEQSKPYWLLRKKVDEKQYYLYENEPVAEPVYYQKAYYDNRWLALKDRQQFKLIDFDDKQLKNETYDSVKILSENFVILFHNLENYPDSISVIFQNHKRIDLGPPTGNKKQPQLLFRLLQAAGSSVGVKKKSASQYLLISNAAKEKQVYNTQGNLIFQGDFDNVTIEGTGLFVIESKGKKGLLDSLGNTLLGSKYQGIGNFDNGNLAVLDRSKFGLYNAGRRIFIKPAYDAILKSYQLDQGGTKQDLFIAKKNNKTGLINASDKVVIPFDYTEIKYWTDSSALVKNEEFWQILKFSSITGSKTPEKLYDISYTGILDFDYIKDTPNEIILRIYKKEGYGMLSNKYGEILGATYDDIVLMADRSSEEDITQNRVFLAEKYVTEADLYIIIHLDGSGKIIRRQALKPEEYDMVFCSKG